MDTHRLCLDPVPVPMTDGVVRATGTVAVHPYLRLSCLLANSDAEEVKQTTMAFRSVLPGVRVEAVYSVTEALDWAAKEPWRIILFAEHLAMADSLSGILSEVRAAAPHAAIVVYGEQDVPPRFMLVDESPADYYWSHRLGQAGSELPLLTLQLIQKHDLHRRLRACQGLSERTEDVLNSMTALLQSVRDYHDTERQAHGIEIENGVAMKLRAAEQILTDLLKALAGGRERERHDERGATRPRR